MDKIGKRLAAAIKATNDAANALEALRLQFEYRGFTERRIPPAPRREEHALDSDRECYYCGLWSPANPDAPRRHWCGYCEKPTAASLMDSASRRAMDAISYAMDQSHSDHKEHA